MGFDFIHDITLVIENQAKSYVAGSQIFKTLYPSFFERIRLGTSGLPRQLDSLQRFWQNILETQVKQIAAELDGDLNVAGKILGETYEAELQKAGLSLSKLKDLLPNDLQELLGFRNIPGFIARARDFVLDLLGFKRTGLLTPEEIQATQTGALALPAAVVAALGTAAVALPFYIYLRSKIGDFNDELDRIMDEESKTTLVFRHHRAVQLDKTDPKKPVIRTLPTPLVSPYKIGTEKYQSWQGQKIPADIPTKNLIKYDPKSDVRTFALPGGGAYSQDRNGNIVKTPRSNYGGMVSKQGFQRDDIIPVSLGGVNGARENIRLLANQIAEAQDTIENEVAAMEKSGAISPKAAITEILRRKDEVINRQTTGQVETHRTDIFGQTEEVITGFLNKPPVPPTAEPTYRKIRKKVTFKPSTDELTNIALNKVAELLNGIPARLDFEIASKSNPTDTAGNVLEGKHIVLKVFLKSGEHIRNHFSDIVLRPFKANEKPLSSAEEQPVEDALRAAALRPIEIKATEETHAVAGKENLELSKSGQYYKIGNDVFRDSDDSKLTLDEFKTLGLNFVFLPEGKNQTPASVATETAQMPLTTFPSQVSNSLLRFARWDGKFITSFKITDLPKELLSFATRDGKPILASGVYERLTKDVMDLAEVDERVASQYIIPTITEPTREDYFRSELSKDYLAQYGGHEKVIQNYHTFANFGVFLLNRKGLGLRV